MTGARKLESLCDAYVRTLVALGESDPKLVVLEADPPGSARASQFGERFRERYFRAAPEDPALMSVAAGLSEGDRTVFASGPAVVVVGQSYDAVRRSVCVPRANVKIVATRAGLLDGRVRDAPPMLEDIGLMRGLPGMTVIVPADAPTAEAATRAVAEREGPAYLRLTGVDLPTVTDGTFRLGRAATLRDGTDLTVVAVGAMVARALELAEDLAAVGVSTRVLDFASVKPFDEPTLLRAARDTGAILVAEEHSVTTGVGALVASATAENYPVPVRRVGVPDVFGEPGDPWVLLDRYGLSLARMREEAWELLRGRGKFE
jgi:transketolase